MSTLKKILKPFVLFAMAVTLKSPFLYHLSLAFLSLVPPLKRRLARLYQNNRQLVGAPLKQFIKEYAKRVLLRMMRFALARPKLKLFCLRFVNKIPALRLRLISMLINRQGVPTESFPLFAAQLSPLADLCYKRLQAAVKCEKESATLVDNVYRGSRTLKKLIKSLT